MLQRSDWLAQSHRTCVLKGAHADVMAKRLREGKKLTQGHIAC